MDERQALMSFAAPSQEARLTIVRTMVVAGPDGLAAGLIPERMGVSPSNVFFHLKELEQSGVITHRRGSRFTFYSASYDALADLVKFLMEDCCASHPMIREGVPRPDGCCKKNAARSEGDIVA